MLYLCIKITWLKYNMNITSEDVALLELFENGKTSDKKYKKLPVAAIKGYVKAVNKMRAATRMEDIMRDKGLSYERLRGDRKDQESVRCNDVWRLIFQSSPADGSIIITEIELIEISHHYD